MSLLNLKICIFEWRLFSHEAIFQKKLDRSIAEHDMNKWEMQTKHFFAGFEEAFIPDKKKKGDHNLIEPTEQSMPVLPRSYKVICWKDPEHFSQSDLQSDSQTVAQRRFSVLLRTNIVLPQRANSLRIPCTITLKAYKKNFPHLSFGVDIRSEHGGIEKSDLIEESLTHIPSQSMKQMGSDIAIKFFTQNPTMSNFVLACDELLNTKPYARRTHGMPYGWTWANSKNWPPQRLPRVEPGAGPQVVQNDDTGDWDINVGDKRNYWEGPAQEPGFGPEDFLNSVFMRGLLL